MNQDIFLHIPLDIIIVYNMDPLAANSMQNRDSEQLRAGVDQTTTEVAICQNNFDQQEELVEAFGGDSIAKGFPEAYDRVNKLEARLVAEKTRQDVAC